MRITSFLALLLISSFGAYAAEQTAKLDLEEVKIYLSGAELIHTAKLKLKEGANEIALENIANNIAVNSINASISGGATIMDISEKRDYLAVKGAPAEVKKLQDSVQAINVKISYLNNEIAALNAEEEILNQNKIMSTKDKSLTPAEIREMAKLYYESKLAISNSRVRIGLEIAKLNEKSNTINMQINELNGGQATSVHQLILAVHSKTAQTADVIIRYYISEASWRPFYDIRVKDVSKPVAIYHKANVWQTSGIDFRDVKLTISTRNPSLYGAMPTIMPIGLDFADANMHKRDYVGAVNSVSGGNSSRQNVRVDGLDISSSITSTLGNETIPSFSSPINNLIAAEFTADLKYTIPSDGKPRHVELTPTDLPASFEYYAAPKYRMESFLVAKITDWESANLLPGEANVYFESSYIGKTQISPEITSDTLALSLGVDKNVVVKREILKDFTETKFLSSDIERSFAYKITVRNAKKEKIKITIEDQIPIAKNEDIKVKFIDGSGAEPDKDTGKIRWIVELEPGKTVEKTLKFSVRHPASRQITSF